MEIWKEFSFDSAHLLPNVPEGHKCRRLHGHTYTVRIYVAGEPDPEVGWIIDFGDIRLAFQPILDALDHRYLNEIEGLENPTAEVLAQWIWKRLAPRLHGLSRIEIQETCTSGCTYSGD